MKLFSILAAMGLLLGCTSSRQSTTEVNGNWQLVMFPSGSKTLTEIFTMNKPELHMENGHISGSTGCNRINGTYILNGNAIQFGNNMAITKMGCPNYDENVFLDAFNRINKYQIHNNELMLMHDSTLLMTFSKTGS
jgi:heat shock protein HslJ